MMPQSRAALGSFFKLIVIVITFLVPVNGVAQCFNTTAYGTGNVPTNQGGSAMINCQYASEYGTWTNIQANYGYTTTGSVATDYLTIVFGSPTGPIVANGVQPITWYPTATGTYYIHVTTNSSCGQQNTCRSITTTNDGQAPPCTNPVQGGTTEASETAACNGQAISLFLNGSSIGTGMFYQWQSSPDGINYTAIPGATNGNYLATQSSATYYRCEVRCLLGAVEYSTTLFMPMKVFLDCYCNSNANSTVDEDILRVAVSTMDNRSSCGVTGGAGSLVSKYSNFKNITSPSLARDDSYAATIEIGTCGTGSYSNMTKVYIDWNQNGLLTDIGEEVYASPAAVNGPNTINFNLTVPIGATLGKTLIRVVTVETTSAANVNPCGTYTWGETEDYLVEVFPVQTCPKPTDFVKTAFDTTSVSLDWTAGGSETKWQLQYGLQGFTLGTGMNAIVNMNSDTILGGLQPNTFYEVYVRGICGPGDTSLWEQKVRFNTYNIGDIVEISNDCGTVSYTDISLTGIGNGLLNNQTLGLTLPFAFYYQKTAVTEISISNNGVIHFNMLNSTIGSFNSNTIATSAATGLYPFWDDLDDAGGMVYYQTTGAAPNRKFIVQWNKKHDFFQGGSEFSFQTVMDEATGSIYYLYDNMQVGSTTYSFGGSATLGLKGPEKTFPLSYNNTSYLQNYSCTEFYYTNCGKIVNLIIDFLNPDMVKLNWTANVPAAAEYTVIYGLSGFDPVTGGSALTTSDLTVIIPGLMEKTSYDVYIYSNCSPTNLSRGTKISFTTPSYCAPPEAFAGSTSIDSIFTSWNWYPTPGYANTGFEMMMDWTDFDTSQFQGSLRSIDTLRKDTLVSASLFPGGVYDVYLRAVCDNFSSTFIGPITVSMPITNDDVCDAEMIPVDGTVYHLTNDGATLEGNESSIAPPLTSPRATDGWKNTELSNTSWFKFVAPASGQVRINSTARDYDGQIAVYRGSCSPLSSLVFVAGNDDEIDGTSLAPNFTICGLTPGNEYYMMHDGATTQTGLYALSIDFIDINAGVSNGNINICSGGTVQLNGMLSGSFTAGTWLDVDGTQRIVEDTLFVSQGMIAKEVSFIYQVINGCASDTTLVKIKVFDKNQAGLGDTYDICKNEYFNLYQGLNGTVNHDGEWKDANGTIITDGIIKIGQIAAPGSYPFTFIIGNGVCPNDTSQVILNIDNNCDFLGNLELEISKVEMYPNPAIYELNVNSPEMKWVEMAILDVNGRKIYSSDSLESSTKINVSAWENGSYFLQLTFENDFRQTYKFLKSR